MDEETLSPYIIYKVVHGSRAYGTHRPDSDYDEKGVACITHPNYLFGMHSFEQKDGGWTDGYDRVIYDVRKFLRLAAACNPNILEVLYVPEDKILINSCCGKLLRDNRHIFLSQHAAKTFGGYAISQMRQLERRPLYLNVNEERLFKWAYHLIRLLRMGIEIMRDGQVIVERPDAAELLRIRNGEVELSQIIDDAKELKRELDGIKSTLPRSTNMTKVNNLAIQIYRTQIVDLQETELY